MYPAAIWALWVKRRKNKRRDLITMTDRIKLTIFIALAAMAIIAVFFVSTGSLYKNPSGKGTFVYEPVEEKEAWMFI